MFKGTTVYFAHEANGIQVSGFRNVWRSGVTGGALVQVTGHRGGQVTWPTTCEKSDTMVYEYEFDLYSIDLQRPRPRKLTITTDLRYEDTPVTKTFASGFRAPSWSPSGKQIVFSRGELRSTSIEGGAADRFTESGDDEREANWAPDGKSIVYCAGPPSMGSQVYVLNLKTAARTQITSEPGVYRGPRVSADGRTVVVTRLEDERFHLWMSRGGEAKPFAFSKDGEESAGCFSPDGTSLAYLSSHGAKSEVVVSTLDGKELRRFEGTSGYKYDLDWSPDGKRLAYSVRTGNGRWVAGTVKVDGSDPRTLDGSAHTVRWSPDSTMLLCETDARGQKDAEKVVIVDAIGSSKALPVDLQVSKPTTRRDEMLGLFHQVYGSYVGNYYDPFFHGMDMPSLRAKYEPRAAACQTKVELYDFINDMIKELHSSHIHLTPAPVKNSVVTAYLGLELDRAPEAEYLDYPIRRVEPGSPAAKAGIQVGEKVSGVNGFKLAPRRDIDRLLTKPASEGIQDCALTVTDAKGEERTLTLKGIDRTAMRELKYENTIARRKRVVREKSAGKLAYHHIKMMAMPEVQRLKSTLEDEAAHAAGLILDERDGVGGLAHRPVCSLLDSTAADRLNAHPASSMRNRNGTTVLDKYGTGQAGGRASGKSWDRPVIMLQNSISRSDKEILPYTFRHLGIGYLVGMPTAGGVIGGSDWTMQDGSKITVSTQGWFTIDGRNMEGWGVPPDYRVPETHEDLYAGRDAQLEKAIEVLLAQMDGRIAPPRKPGAQEKKPVDPAQAKPAKPAPTLEEHVRFLASPELKGREAGSEGEKKAAEYIEAQLRRSGLDVQVQEFDAHAGVMVRNVIGVIRGKVDEAVVVGAHFDHLGEIKGQIHPGADDNASGTAVLLRVAEKLAKTPPKRTIVVVAFSGEEFGAFGSRYYVNHPSVPLEKTIAMVNMDMVGRLGEKLIVFGADTGDKFRDYLADSAIPLVLNKDPGGQSDHTSFQMKSIPAVHLFTGSHADYHKAGDTADKVNYEGMARVATLTESLVRKIAEGDRIAFQKEAAPAPRVEPAKGAVPYFGSAPDYGFEGKGVRLAGVNPGSPAEKAGLKEGDVIVEFNGKSVEDVKSYSDKLYGCKPGDEITVVYERDGKRGNAKATLGARKKNNDE